MAETKLVASDGDSKASLLPVMETTINRSRFPTQAALNLLLFPSYVLHILHGGRETGD